VLTIHAIKKVVPGTFGNSLMFLPYTMRA